MRLFELKSASETGIDFSNTISESYEFNIINYQDFYSGGGVSIGDVNNDGLADLFFTANMVENSLYLNQGSLQFEDVTEAAGLGKDDYTWCTGSTMVDINNDGWLDIYVSYSGLVPVDQRRNKLYINQKDGTFRNEAKKYGLDDPGYAVNANFFDMDKDGDLDMYLVNQGPEKNTNFSKTVSRDIPNEYCGDKLFRNDDQVFVDVTLDAGIYSSLIGFGHGAAVGDLNQDGWDDIFVCNDFFEHDYLYLNNHDGTFSEVLKSSMKHISNYSMGNDLADFNNDGLLDIMVVDMVAEDYRRQKQMLSTMNRQLFRRTFEQGYHYQYMCNTMHLNNGNTTFSEIAHAAGVSNTDWSWGPLLADFDGDGLKDLFVSNGLRKDIRNRDWAKLFNETLDLYSSYELFSKKEWDLLLNALPAEKIPNYIYRNRGDFIFENATDFWGLAQPSFSNGAAYGDLDNDGDLDLVVNNVDDPAFIYENLANQSAQYNYIKVRLEGGEHNRQAFGAKVYVTLASGQQQLQQHFVTRGYRSSMDPNLIFGLGEDSLIAEIKVIWPDSTLSVLKNIPANQLLTIDKQSAVRIKSEKDQDQLNHPWYETVQDIRINYHHRENTFDPYQYQPLLPYRMSELGPTVGVADVNQDGLDDFFIGGARGRSAHLFLQEQNLTFKPSNEGLFYAHRMFEDAACEFLDIDLDNDMDLYVVSGGYENGDSLLIDRIYVNDGQGNFSYEKDRLPSLMQSGGQIVPADFDLDGDLDLFSAGRQVPMNYPQPADSYLLINENGYYKDLTGEFAQELVELGMVTDAVWTDFDNDQDLDLVLIGEWMKIEIFENMEGKFQRLSSVPGLENSQGWWNCIEAADFDNDGDEDYIAGNLGINYRYKASNDYPFLCYSIDLTNNEREEIILAYFENGILRPVDNLERALLQFPELGQKINKHDQYAELDLREVYGESVLSQAKRYQVKTFKSHYIENLGDGSFKMKPLPNQAQLSPINTLVVDDINLDGNKDILAAGNLYSSEEQTVRIDAGIGIVLLGDGQGNFKTVPGKETGFFADGDVKEMAAIQLVDWEGILIAKRNDSLQFVRKLHKSKIKK